MRLIRCFSFGKVSNSRARSALVEVGAQTNTFEEACNAMMPLAELLDMVLQGK
jgi:hypothetical protein